MKLIELYKQWMETGSLPMDYGHIGYGGLCNYVPKKYLSDLKYFHPKDGKTFWASDSLDKIERFYAFNNIRQTIVLFICAMHDEL